MTPKTNALLKKTTAGLLALALTGAVPGLPLYRAAAQMLPGMGQGARVLPGAPIVPVRSGGMQPGFAGAAPSFEGMASIGDAPSFAVTPGFQGAPAAAAAPRAGVPQAAAVETPQDRAVRAAETLRALSEDAPEFGKLSDTGSSSAGSADFHRRTRQAFEALGKGEVSVHMPAAPLASWAHSSKDSKGKGSRKSMPEQPGHVDGEPDGDHVGVPDPDGSLNQRKQDDGPDSVSDEPSRGGNAPLLLSIAITAMLLPTLVFAAGASGVSGVLASLVEPAMIVPMLIAIAGVALPVAVIGEMARGVVATALGDATPREKGRLTLNPIKHLGVSSLTLPALLMFLPGLIGLATGPLLGFRPTQVAPLAEAKEMPVDPSRMRYPRLGRLLTALTNPVLNVALAVAAAKGAALYASTVTGFVLFGAIQILLPLAIFNLVGLPGFNGGQIARVAFQTVPGMGVFDRMYDRVEKYLEAHPYVRTAYKAAVGLIVLPAAGIVAMAVSEWLIMDVFAVAAASAAAPAVQLAAGWLPGFMAIGMAVSAMLPGTMSAARQLRLPDQPRMTGILTGALQKGPGRAKILVDLGPKAGFKLDYHVDNVDWSQPNAMWQFQESVTAMVAQLDKAGLAPAELEAYGAAPVANYKLIDTATLSVPEDRKAEFEARLIALGYRVHQNRPHSIIRPVDPDDARGNPLAKDVTLAEVVAITGADKVQAILKKELEGSVDAASLRVPSFAKGLTIRILKALGVMKAPVNPAGSVIDTGVDKDHPMLKGTIVRDGRDGHGHGTWVASAVTAYDPYQKNLRAYNTFSNGSSTTDDILRDYTLADNEGAEWFTNSWGDSYGDPDAPEAKLVRAIAEKGKIQFFAAGNQGPGDNTVGGPAIAFFKDPKTGAMTVISVGATDSDKATAWFQSRGPHSPYFESKPEQAKEYPVRVDVQSVGHRIYGAYPTYMRGADRTDPKLGPQKRSSGTSMSTPTVAGAYSLLRQFGFAPVAIVKALLEHAENLSKPEAEGGKGHMDVHAMYLALKKAQDATIGGRVRGLLARVAVALVVRP